MSVSLNSQTILARVANAAVPTGAPGDYNGGLTLAWMFQLAAYEVSRQVAAARGTGAFGESLSTAQSNVSSAESSYDSAQAVFPLSPNGHVGG